MAVEPVGFDALESVGRCLSIHEVLDGDGHGKHIAVIPDVPDFAACWALLIDEWAAIASWIRKRASSRCWTSTSTKVRRSTGVGAVRPSGVVGRAGKAWSSITVVAVLAGLVSILKSHPPTRLTVVVHSAVRGGCTAECTMRIRLDEAVILI